MALACVASVFGCAGQQLPSATALDCRIALLEPYVGELAEQLIAGNINTPGDVAMALLNLGVAPDEVYRLGDAWRACAGAVSVPVQAQPPIPGKDL